MDFPVVFFITITVVVLFLITIAVIFITYCALPHVGGITQLHIDGLVQERHNFSALAMELRLSCTNPSICPPNFAHGEHVTWFVVMICFWSILPLSFRVSSLVPVKQPWRIWVNTSYNPLKTDARTTTKERLCVHLMGCLIFPLRWWCMPAPMP